MPTVNSSQNSVHSNKGGQFIPVKVVEVVLDMNFPDIEKIGGWDALGTILYIKVSDIVKDPEIEYRRDNSTLISSNNLARPLFANTKYFPLKGEIVLLYSTTGRDILKDTSEAYYLPNINIWNHPHHNALPNPDTYNGVYPSGNDNKTKDDYLKSSGGLVRQVQDGDTEIPLGNYFKEQLNTKPLLPFEGDHILEGRFGNSIRFGSTSPGPNDWSSTGLIGSPITIIRNGQSNELDSKGWEPTVEDVNRDPSSIYLTSTQKLDKFVPASLNWQSWGAKLTIVEDPITALESPVIEEYTEPEPTTNEEEVTNALIAGTPTDDPPAVETTPEEEVESEDNAPPPPEPKSEEVDEKDDELSLYDELIESGDYDEDDFDEGENPVISGQDIAVSDIERQAEGEDTSSGDTQGNSNWVENRAKYKRSKKELYETWGYPDWTYPASIPGKKGTTTTVNAPAAWSTVKNNLGPTNAKKKFLCIHCTAGNQNKEPIESVLGMLYGDTGVSNLGGDRAGYHIMIQKDGKCVQVYKDTFTAYGASGYNSNGIHINWMGGASSFNMTNAQAKTLNEVVKTYITRYPSIQVVGHNQIAKRAKSCPRFFVPAYARKLGVSESQIYTTEKYMKEGGGYASVGNIVNSNIA
jgi:N-acetylmuramoyl-L-alanine amidase